MHNLLQAVERYLTRKYASLKQIPPPETEAAGAARPSSSKIKRRRYALNPEREAIHTLREQQRQEKYWAIKARREQGVLRDLQSDETLREARQLARQFMTMVRNRQHEKWQSWLESCASSSVKELCNFASGLRRDEAAVKAALSEPWISGQVEGQINRPKFYKRQMCGRAKFDLLRLRVLYVA